MAQVAAFGVLFVSLASLVASLPVQFNDIVSPAQLLREKIDASEHKRLLANASELHGIENRFAEEIDDDAEGFRLNIKALIESDELVEVGDGALDESARQRYENGEYFQGDMILTRDQQKYFFTNESDGEEEEEEEDGSESDGFLPSRTGIISRKYRWKKARGEATIPYLIWSDSAYNARQKMLIRSAMDHIEDHTCIRFKERTTENDFILIYNGNDCSSFMGRAGGQQLVSLRKHGCFSRGIIVHELLHTIGLDHMQNHYDRDDHIQIVWDNIKKENRYNFLKSDPRKFNNFDTKYDYYSIMHYDPVAFSNNGRRTIVPHEKKHRDVIGQRRALSKGDVTRIKNMYECKNEKRRKGRPQEQRSKIVFEE